MTDFRVKIEYKNEDLETVVEKEYDFVDYTETLNLDLKRILKEIEDAFYYLTGGKQKNEWPKEVMDRFQKIRHKLLDEANAIRRLPQNLYYKNVPANTMPFGDFLARTLN